MSFDAPEGGEFSQPDSVPFRREDDWARLAELAHIAVAESEPSESGELHIRIPFEDGQMCSYWSSGEWVVRDDLPVKRANEIVADLLESSLSRKVMVTGCSSLTNPEKNIRENFMYILLIENAS